MIEFQAFPKMARLSREIVITEKIDGTNAQILVSPRLDSKDPTILTNIDDEDSGTGDGWEIRAGSRSRWLTREADNFGFAKWVQEHAEDLLQLGEGRHFGEWWGSGIQRGYGLKEKRFSLFNVGRWIDPHNLTTQVWDNTKQQVAPECCHIVPVLWRGEFDTTQINIQLRDLKLTGSKAAPSFMNPEGIVVWHTAANIGFKKTIEKDESPKSK